MPDPTPTPLATCDDNLPLLPIMRQFDFGQFVFLHERPKEAAPGIKKGNERPPKIVIDPSGGRAQAYKDWLERAQVVNVKGTGPAPTSGTIGPVVDPLGGVSLQRLLDDKPPIAEAPTVLPLDGEALAVVFREGTVEHGGKKFDVVLDTEAVRLLTSGQPALVLLNAKDKRTQQFMVQMSPDILSVSLDGGALDTLLATSEVTIDGEVERLEMTPTVNEAILAGQPVVVRTAGEGGGFLRVEPAAAPSPPASTSVMLENLAHFLARPHVPGADGRPIPLVLKAGDVKELRQAGATVVTVGGTRVTLLAGQGADSAVGGGTRVSSSAVVKSDGAGVIKEIDATNVAKPKASPDWASPLGLPLAVFMPWRQTWELTGFSRGELRSSLELVPQEEMTIEISSWERRTRTLDQSSETAVEQSFESSQTDRATDDVFHELTNRHDFNWQIEGSVDATYSTGNGSISLSAGGQVRDTSQLQSIARTTQQRMKESTQKASAKVRSLRTTHITDTVEGGSQTRVTRKLKNSNFCHTLTFVFFETLAHYKVTLAAVPERLRLVALLANPVAEKEFTRELIRRNETALRRALLDSSLVDGFDACRKTRAYESAIGIISEQAAMGATTDAAANSAGPPPVPAANKAQTPQELAVVEVLKQIGSAYSGVTTNAACKNAMSAISQSIAVDEGDRMNAQHWLFLKLCNKYLPSLIAAISKVPPQPAIAHAGAVVAVIPPPGASVTLGTLNDKSDIEKEQAGLGHEIADNIGNVWWNYSTGRAREELLYVANDGGLAGLVNSLQRVYQEYLAKESEGQMATEKDVVIAKAAAQQDKLSTADKLSMAFPLDELASAREREEALKAHLNDHKDHYNFALFQGLAPAEQSAYIERAAGGALEVGMFEPRVIAINGAQLAVPLAPPPAGDLLDFIESLRKSFKTAFSGTADDPDQFIFPTPGLTIMSRLGSAQPPKSSWRIRARSSFGGFRPKRTRPSSRRHAATPESKLKTSATQSSKARPFG